jgi:hypothetical protein
LKDHFPKAGFEDDFPQAEKRIFSEMRIREIDWEDAILEGYYSVTSLQVGISGLTSGAEG